VKNTKSLDVICLGRASVDLYGQQIGDRLQDISSFAKSLGGSSCNICFGAARLGLRASMLTRVGDEQFGEFIREELARAGVDTSHVVTDKERLTALAILSIKSKEEFPLLFYRADCADMAIDVSDFDEAYIASSESLLITGTHFSTPHVDKVARQAITYAKRNDTKVILDIDYRPVLWGLTRPGDGDTRFILDESVTKHLQSIVPLCDLIVGTEEEVHIAGGTTNTVMGIQNSPEVSFRH
jgi:5-dehydro-2-deoxygluconokinase